MKKFEYVYFTIYNYYSRQSYYHDSLSVRLKSMYLLALSAGGWILCFQLLFLRFIKTVWFSSQQGAMLFALTIYIGTTFFFHWFFIMKERDQKIFHKYASAWDDNPNKRRDLFFALTITSIPYIVMAAVKLFFPRG
ncbi:MAG: hypothetical protein ACKVOW_18490 [Chitinophagaceae bacterium]